MLILVSTITSGTINFHTFEGGSSMYNLYQISPGMRMEIARSRQPLIVTNAPAVSSELKFPDNVPFGGKPVFEVLSELFKLVRGILVTLQSHFEGNERTRMGSLG